MSELDQTIEELEAEVLAELEEAEDPTKQGAAPAEKSKMKIDAEDTGIPVVDPEQKDAPAKKSCCKSKRSFRRFSTKRRRITYETRKTCC